ncbi:phosphotransferase [Paenibacillus sp. CC-CFT747]|nr:phosphotransferase [Paenibacillus sp. CC-CFT747]
MEQSVERLFGEAVLEEATSRFGLKAGGLKKLGDFENYVYEGEVEGEAKGEPRILRLTHSSHRSEEELLAELDWIRHLVEAGLSIPKYYSSLEGRRTERVTVGDSYFTACVFAKAQGHAADPANTADWNEEMYAAWGMLTGRVHAATRSYVVPEGLTPRPSWAEDELLQEPEKLVLPGDEYVLQRLEEIVTHLKGLPRGPEAYGLIHTDIHSGNFLVEDGRLTVFDFDDSAYNWFAHDLAIPLYYAVSAGKLPEMYKGDRGLMRRTFSGRSGRVTGTLTTCRPNGCGKSLIS